jgi:predicted GNAT superfamily acetyltransferase
MVILIIKPINTPDLIKEVAGVEAETWGMNPGDTVPDHILTAIAHDGGVLLGAYDSEQLIGFTLGWLGTVTTGDEKPASDQLKLVSHMTGVIAGYRDHRIGYHLKLAQRDWALKRDLDLITWTYDPLESRNAYLNIHLLGCTCQTYFRDYYGEMSDEMNQGIPSDRFRVDWWIRSKHVEDRLEDHADNVEGSRAAKAVIPSDGQILNPADFGPRAMLIPSEKTDQPLESCILIEIPADMQSIRQQDSDLALDWRFHTRDLFEEAFLGGYQIVDLIYIRGDQSRSYYLLERGK